MGVITSSFDELIHIEKDDWANRIKQIAYVFAHHPFSCILVPIDRINLLKCSTRYAKFYMNKESS
jgi:hypothetical protein